MSQFTPSEDSVSTQTVSGALVVWGSGWYTEDQRTKMKAWKKLCKDPQNPCSTANSGSMLSEESHKDITGTIPREASMSSGVERATSSTPSHPDMGTNATTDLDTHEEPPAEVISPEMMQKWEECQKKILPDFQKIVESYFMVRKKGVPYLKGGVHRLIYVKMSSMVSANSYVDIKLEIRDENAENASSEVAELCGLEIDYRGSVLSVGFQMQSPTLCTNDEYRSTATRILAELSRLDCFPDQMLFFGNKKLTIRSGTEMQPLSAKRYGGHTFTMVLCCKLTESKQEEEEQALTGVACRLPD